MPKYHYVFSDLKSKIQNGEFKINEILPSESQLQDYYGVSRITIRRAMDELQDISLVRKYPGIGTIVINNKNVIKLKTVSSFSDENKEKSSKLIKFEEVIAPIDVRVNMNLSSKDKVYIIERLRVVEGKKIGVHIAYVPTKFIKLKEDNFIEKDNSLYKIFKEQNIELNSGEETIEAISSDEKISKILELNYNSPILYKERVSFYDGKAVEFVKMFYRGDAYKYQIHLEN